MTVIDHTWRLVDAKLREIRAHLTGCPATELLEEHTTNRAVIIRCDHAIAANRVVRVLKRDDFVSDIRKGLLTSYYYVRVEI